MNNMHLHTMNLQSKIISQEKIIEAYRSSEKYEKQREIHRKDLNKKDVIISDLKQKAAEFTVFHKKAIREWMKTTVEMDKKHQQELAIKDKIIKQQEAQLQKAYAELQTLYDCEAEYKATIQNLSNKLDDETGKIIKLKAQVNRDYENSSKPSSSSPFRKKIANGRVTTGKKQGGQIGHQGHCRKQYEPTNIIHIEVPKEYLDSTKYVATGKIIKKQVVNISLVVQVDEYQTPEYRCIENRHKVHAAFPEGISNEVNFGAGTQALAFLLNNYYNVSIAKTRDFLYEASGKTFRISTGCINQMCKKFSQKSKPQQAKLFDDLVKVDVLQADFTTARVNGKLMQVLVCASGNQMMYYAREHKGYQGIEGSPIAHTLNTIVSDHEISFFAYGSNHQECLVHVLRYLRSSMENESELSWNKRMYDTIRKMMHYVKHTDVRDEEEIDKLMKEYDMNLEIAELNYQEHPPTKYYRDGYNLAKRMRENRDYHILFLVTEGIPYDNNLCERLARVMKRKMKQMTTFRSFESFSYTCDSLGMIESLRMKGGSLLEEVAEVFS